jgi:flagellar hook-basal body complex protein FliE
MAIPAIGAVNALTQLQSTAATQSAPAADGFGNSVAKALDGVAQSQQEADQLAVQASTGNLADLHDYTIAAAQASVQTELVVALRDRAVEAFNEIMRMQI